ncbi:MAG: carbohydrate ABC transporter permease, partial [Chthoniobacterales bacterium]
NNMSFFSPITARSAAIRWIYLVVYIILTLGGLTMLLPLLVSVTSSVAGGYDAGRIGFYPEFLTNKTELWRRYLDAKYVGRTEMLGIAWGQAKTFPASAELPAEPPDLQKIQLWEQFVKETNPPMSDFLLGFTRSTNKEASYYNRGYVNWLLENNGGSLKGVNAHFDTTYANLRQILPPLMDAIGPVALPNPVTKAFNQFCDTVPLNRKIAWNIGNYFRLYYLPQKFGSNIDLYNAKYNTTYKKFGEIPFPATVPNVGQESWITFVSRALSTRFTELSPEGEAARAKLGMDRAVFIRTVAKPEYFRINSLDIQYADWAAKHGVTDARIPQKDLDNQDFQATKAFWAGQFLTQNYAFVLNEIVFQGTAFRNTIILIVLTVGGALIINPLAAYALSRFKLRQSYTLLLFFLLTISFPAEVTLIPNFLLLKELGWLNTFAALVIPSLVNGFSVFLLKGFFDSLPRELYEAAEIDGASEWTIFWGVTMNLSQPILAVIALGAFTSAYGAFMFALITAPDPKMWTLMVYIYQLRQSVTPPIIYASVILTALPVLVVFLFAQNIILRGIVVPSDK